MAGYSGTPLLKKIGIKPGRRIAFVPPPTELRFVIRVKDRFPAASK